MPALRLNFPVGVCAETCVACGRRTYAPRFGRCFRCWGRPTDPTREASRRDLWRRALEAADVHLGRQAVADWAEGRQRDGSPPGAQVHRAAGRYVGK